jgi:hypothetical protein
METFPLSFCQMPGHGITFDNTVGNHQKLLSLCNKVK